MSFHPDLTLQHSTTYTQPPASPALRQIETQRPYVSQGGGCCAHLDPNMEDPSNITETTNWVGESNGSALYHTAIVVHTLMWNTWKLETSLGWFMESVATKLLLLNSYKSTLEIQYIEINIIFVRVTLRFKNHVWLLNLSALNWHSPICKVSNIERSFMHDASMYKYLCVCR